MPLHSLPLYHSAQMHVLPDAGAGRRRHQPPAVEAPDLDDIFERVPRDGIDSLFFAADGLGRRRQPPAASADADLS